MGPSLRFDAESTAAEVVAGIDMSGKTIIVTGGSSGIGVETARALAGAGAEVVLAIRNPEAGAELAAEIGGRVEQLDLADLRSVDAFVARWDFPLHVLVNNAGVMMTPEARTAQGWELQLATNHLGHFALAVGLEPSMVDGARVVVVSSSGHGNSPVVFEDLMFDRRPYDSGLAYGQSKTANVLFAVEANRRWASRGITANALMPGGIFTNLQRHWDPAVLADMQAQHGAASKTPEQGAATSVLLATAPHLPTGRYFEDCHEAVVVEQITDGLHGVMAYALDSVAAERLWDISLALIARARASGAPSSPATPSSTSSTSG